MKIIKLFSVFLCLLIICSILFTACGEKENESTKDESAPGETTVVLETTSNGGTIEQDSESNKITKDENGKVVSVEDKNGNSIDVTEYLTTHTWVESNSNSSGGSGSSGSLSSSDRLGSSGGSSESGSPGGSSGSSSSGSSGGSGSSSVSGDEAVEESIPVIVATIPDDDDLVELPDL